MCRDGVHYFTWSGTTTTGDPGPSLRCHCGSMKRGDADPLAAAVALVEAKDQRIAALETALAPVLAYLTALVESADNQGHLREGDVRSDKLAMVNDVCLLRSDIAALSLAATGPAAREANPNLLIIDTTNAQMVQMPHVNAAAPSMPTGVIGGMPACCATWAREASDRFTVHHPLCASAPPVQLPEPREDCTVVVEITEVRPGEFRPDLGEQEADG